MSTSPCTPRAISRTSGTPVQPFSLPRSVALAAAAALHLGLAAMLAMPIAAPGPEPEAPTVIPIDWPASPPPPPIQPPPQPAPVVRTLAPPRPALTTPAPVAAPTPSPDPITGPTIDTPSPLDVPASPSFGEPAASGPVEASLQLRSGSPPRYPRAALARRLEGEVELLILVGVDGRPETVTVTRSSGHAVLDRAAREHVLRRWVFEPSFRHGAAVPAFARVPVRFALP